MKLKSSSNIIIAKSKMPKADTVLEPLDYQKWVNFVDGHLDKFTWKENTEDGIKILNDIDNVPEDFKERVRASLNKISCYAEFNEKRGYYDIYAGFNGQYNWITINFARTPKREDIEVFIAMAKHLDAYLLNNGTEIIDEKVLESMS